MSTISPEPRSDKEPRHSDDDTEADRIIDDGLQSEENETGLTADFDEIGAPF